MKPILFNTEMVKAILEGRKTVTRRVVKPSQYMGLEKNIEPKESVERAIYRYKGITDYDVVNMSFKPPYQVNDILYVRETWQNWSCTECDWECVPDNGSGFCTMPKYLYKATDEETDKGWKPSIHMPKEAARLFLRVTGVRVERLQDITEVQATKEGCKAGSFEYKGAVWGQEDTDEWTAVEDFANVWQLTIKKDQLDTYGWCANPYVWVIEFKDISEDIKNGRV